MATPTQAEFASFLAEARRRHELSPALTGVLDHGRTCTRDELEDYIHQLLAERAMAFQSLVAHPVVQWLEQQREFGRAHKLVFYGRRVPKSDPVEAKRAIQLRVQKQAEQYVADYHEETLRGAADAAELSRVRLISFDPRRRALRAYSSDPSGFHFGELWVTRVAEALDEYYHTANWEESVEASRAWRASLIAAKDAVRRMAELATIHAKFDPVGAGGFRTEVLERTLERLPLNAIFPVQRKDPHARERLFVYRVYRANRREARKAKAEAIVELMGLEGFAHQYEVRNVEKICAEFTERFSRRYKENLPVDR